jgi:glycolate oxidase
MERVSAARVEQAKILLDRALGGSKLLTEAVSLEPYGYDRSEAAPVTPDIVVRAKSIQDIEKTLAIAQETGVPVTPRSGGSGKTGGAVPSAGGIVLCTQGMQNILEINPNDMLAVVEPGVILSDFHHAVEREGLFYPPDPNSAAYCCLGGNLAENAGGPRAFKYGVTRDYVLGCETVLMGGQPLQLGKRTVKGVTGYDLTALMVGSEGTLGVLTKATLKLIAKPAQVHTILAQFPSVRVAGSAVSAFVRRGLVPRCLELLDAGALEALRTFNLPLDADAQALLILEVDGEPNQCDADLEQLGNACDEVGATSVWVAQSESQRDRLWAARRDLSPAIRKLSAHKLSEDVVVPRSRIPDLLDEVARISEKTTVRTLAYGHAGDGNLHVNFLWNHDHEIPNVNLAIEALFREVIAMHGTLSGEHGIGILKAPYLHLEQSPELIALQKQIKQVFDPHNLLNPGKIFPTSGTHRAC